MKYIVIVTMKFIRRYNLYVHIIWKKIPYKYLNK